jgi:hypothetical protein
VFTKSASWNAFLKSLNCNKDNSAAYHQQANGQTERYVQEIKPLIRIKCQNNLDAWPSTLPNVMASLNSSDKATTGMSAFKALLGYEPTLPIELTHLHDSTCSPETSNRHKDIIESTLKCKGAQQASYNNNLTSKLSYSIGDDVYVKKFLRNNSVDVCNVPGKVLNIRGPDSYIVSSSQGVQSVNASHLQPLPTSSNFSSHVKPSSQSLPNIVTPLPNNSPTVVNSVIASKDLIGKRVTVWWDDYNRYYTGTVVPSDDKRKGSHIVKYDDGQEVYEWLIAPKNRIQVEYDEIVDSKRIPKPNVFKEVDFDDDQEDDDYVPNSDSSDTDFSSDDNSESS